MVGRASAWIVTVAVLASLVPPAYGAALRSSHEVRNEASSSSVDHIQLRTSTLKSFPPFDLNPDTFLSFVGSVSTDSLLLFFSPTCPDCEKFAPVWSQVAGLFEDDRDLTILSVSDDAGKAPAPYTHNENPAVFFIPKGDAAHPIAFPMSYLHEFVALDETAETDKNLIDRLVSFTNHHVTTATRTALPEPVAPAAATAIPMQTVRQAQEGMLTARLLASLKTKEAESFQDQLSIVYEPQYKTLAVAEFLKSPTGVLGPPLYKVAANYLDGLPLAQQWAKQYATQQDATYRKKGWKPTRKEEQKYFQDMLNYATPMYARSIYAQRGLSDK